MTSRKLDLLGLKCPMPVFRTRKALMAMSVGDTLEVICSDPLSVLDIPTLIHETGDRVEIAERTNSQIVFVIEKRSRADG